MDKHLNGMALHNLNILNSVIRQFGNGEEIFPRSVWTLRDLSGHVFEVESDEALENTLEEMAGSLALKEAARRVGLNSDNWNAEYANLIDKVYVERDHILAIAKERS